MTTTTSPSLAEKILALNLDQVASVYSGKPGCACGCRGTYRYAAAHRAASENWRGYPIADNEVNDRQVKKVLALFQANADEVWEAEDGIYALDLSPGRTYTLYQASPCSTTA